MSYHEWSHQPPPHGRNPVFFDGPCPCEDCELYRKWEEYAEELTAEAGETEEAYEY